MAQKTLILSRKKTALTAILPREQSGDILIIQELLNQGMGWKLALEYNQMYDMEILLLVPVSMYDQVMYQLSDTGIFIVCSSCPDDVIFQSVEWLRIRHKPVKKYQQEITRLTSVVKKDRIINRAKLLLIEAYHWSEKRAQRFIEQAAVNESITKWEVAEKIIAGADNENK